MDTLIYFYNGFAKPKQLATSLDELNQVIITDSYRGDITDDFIEDIGNVDLENEEEANELLNPYDLYLNPTLEQLFDAACVYFGRKDVPNEHFVPEFGSNAEMNQLKERCYDTFKRYPNHCGRVLLLNYIRNHYCDNDVLGVFDTIEDAQAAQGEDEDTFILCIDYAGRAYVPVF